MKKLCGPLEKPESLHMLALLTFALFRLPPPDACLRKHMLSPVPVRVAKCLRAHLALVPLSLCRRSRALHHGHLLRSR